MKRCLFILVALLFAACAHNEIDEVVSERNAQEKVYASIADDETRVELNSNRHTVWTADDTIYIFGPDTYKLYEFDGKTGDANGSFSLKSTYKLPELWELQKYYAFYPTELFEGCNFIDGSFYIWSIIPQVQEYKKGSYGDNTNTMIGVNQGKDSYLFNNVLGYLRVSITGDKRVKNIELRGNNHETLAGEYYFVADDFKSLYWYDAQTETITIDCGKQGVQLSSTPTEFYFVMMPDVYPNGISLSVNFDDGSSFVKSTTKSITIKSNTIQPMTAFEAGDNVDWQIVTIEHTGSRIVAPKLYGSTSVAGYVYWGDDSSSTLNSDSSHVYYDGEESHTLTIKAVNATTVELSTCAGITSLDFSNF